MIFSPEYPLGGERGNFLTRVSFQGRTGDISIFDLLFNEARIFLLGDCLDLRKRDLASLILSHQSTFWEEKGGIFSPEYSSEVNGGIFWDSLTRVSFRRRTGEGIRKFIYLFFLFW